MTKTIFDYDSSDDEKISYPVIQSIKIDHNILYNAGNAIINSENISLIYKEHKSRAGYKKVNSSTSINNKFLTQKEYLEEDKKLESLNLLINESSKDAVEVNDDDIKAIIAVQNLYKQIETTIDNQEISKENIGLINTENFKCFAVLQQYIDRDNLDAGAAKDIGAAFGILTKEKTGHIAYTKTFWENIKSLQCKETIGNFFFLIKKYSSVVSLFNDEIAQIISNTKDDIDQSRVEAVFKITELCKTKAQIIINAKTLYEEVEKKLPTGGVINTENLKFFKVLNSCKSLVNISSEEQVKIVDAFNLSKEGVQGFLESIHEIKDIKKIILELLELTSKSSNILNNKITNYITSKKHTLNFDFALDILCDEQLSLQEGESPILFNQLSNFDSIVNDKIKKLQFFNTSDNKETDAQKFLASSLTYQKFLKTITKFTLLRTYGNEINTNIQCSTGQYQSKDYFKTIDAKSILSTSLKRTEEISGLGSYSNVSKMLQQAQEKLRLDNGQLIAAFKSILKGKDLYNQYKTTPDTVKALYDITYLLFSCEPNRNPEALISNAMFLELIEKGKSQITDMATNLPMAMSSEQNKQGGIGIGRYYHEQYEEQTGKRARKNDYGESKLKDTSPEVQEFIIKESVLFQKWLGLEEIVGESSLKLIEENKVLSKRKQKEEDKEEKKKIQQEIDEKKTQIQKIADDCKEQFSKVNEENAVKELSKLIQNWYNIEIKLTAAGDKKEELWRDDEENISPHKSDLAFRKQELLLQNLIQKCVEQDHYHLSDFTNSNDLDQRKGFLETLKYWYIEPIIKILNDTPRSRATRYLKKFQLLLSKGFIRNFA